MDCENFTTKPRALFMIGRNKKNRNAAYVALAFVIEACEAKVFALDGVLWMKKRGA